ncbi:MAG: penicillin-binding protein 2, partial [Gammaproteobacteria bacterium]
HGRRGTARKVGKDAQYEFAGKTGTAQVSSIKQNEEAKDCADIPEKLRDHALFIAFAPFKKPEIAVAVIAEHGCGGSSVAAPIARRVLDKYFKIEPPPAEEEDKR